MNTTSKTPITSNYIELLKKVLIDHRNIGEFEYYPLPIENANWKTAFLYPVDKLLRKRNFIIAKRKPVIHEERMYGYDWPAQALTMIGYNRLTNIEQCIHAIIQDKVEGDLIEAGVWRGGAALFMRAMLKELSVTNRKVWLADSFRGLPKPDAVNYKADKWNRLNRLKILNVGMDEVKHNFEKYDLLDDQVKFLPGWFKDTLPEAPIEKLSLIRLDADMYESTWQALENLYPKLYPGGFVIVDDYYAFKNCKQAVDEFREKAGITEPTIDIDLEAIYWRKAK